MNGYNEKESILERKKRMQPINAEYRITVSDYRRACYYGLFLRHRRALFLMFVVVGFGLLYLLFGLMGWGTVYPLVVFLAGAYLIWGLLLFAAQERDIMKYVKSPGNLLGVTYQMTLDEGTMRVRIPEKGTDVSCPVTKLACAYEMSSLFLLYTSAADVYLLPVRALTEEERAGLREMLRRKLKDRFGTRFEKKEK